MAYLTTTRPTSLAAFGWVLTLRERLAESLARHARYRRTRDELEAMSDRDLADINISRCDIPAIAAEAAYGK